MPPKKKGKGVVRAASTPGVDDDVMAIDTPQEPGQTELPEPAELTQAEYSILQDPWTDEQETSLYKGVIKWKPAGLHKHFRMIALSEHLRNHGYDPQVDQHTRIPGIWKKLRTLYNLDIIDDRENSFEYEEDSEDKYKEFKIPNDLNMEHEMFMRGKRPEAQTPSEVGSSPPRLFERSPSPRENRKRKRDLATKGEGTGSIADTDEVPTSPVAASSPAAKTTRSGRSTNRRARVEQESAVESKNTTADEDEGDDEEEVAEESQEEASDEEAEAPSQTKGASRSKPGPPARTATATRRGKRKR